MSGGFPNKQETADELTAGELLWVQTGAAGIVLLLEQASAPSPTATYGKLYTKTSDSKLYFMNDSGVEISLSDAAGGGTVTTVSVVTANGVSGSVANATTTPAITLTLGNITPSGVQVSGLTASEIVITDASKNLVSAAVATYPSLTELTYLKGVTSAIQTQINTKGAGTVTTVGFTGGLISVANATTTPALTVAGTDGGVPYFSSTSTWASSGLLAANALMIGGGAGAAPATITTGTGVVTALGVNVGSAGAFVTFNGALGTPSSGTVTNLTGTASININGTVGATTPSTGVFTTLVAGSTTSLLLGTAGSAVGNVGFRNATSGTITLAPVTGALGTVTLTLPAVTDTVAAIAATQTLTNKRVTKRTGTTTSSATPTINTDNVDEYYITAQAEAITSFTTNLSGTPTLGQLLFISVIGTAARGITWGASFANGPVALPSTTVTTTQLSVLLKWDGSIWRCYATGSTV